MSYKIIDDVLLSLEALSVLLQIGYNKIFIYIYIYIYYSYNEDTYGTHLPFAFFLKCRLHSVFTNVIPGEVSQIVQ